MLFDSRARISNQSKVKNKQITFSKIFLVILVSIFEFQFQVYFRGNNERYEGYFSLQCTVTAAYVNIAYFKKWGKMQKSWAIVKYKVSYTRRHFLYKYWHSYFTQPFQSTSNFNLRLYT